MSIQWRRLTVPLLLCALSLRLWAGGTGLNVVVVVNQNSTNSVQLGNYYCEQRQVPPQNLLRASWAGGNVAWQKSDLQTVITTPLLAMLAARQLTNQIDYVLLCMDFPYRVENGGYPTASGSNGTTSALFYGFKTDYPPTVNPGSCSLPTASANTYAGSECRFRQVGPGTSPANFLAMMLTWSNLAQAKEVIDGAVASDGTFPTQTAYLTKSTDAARNIRYPLFDNAIFNTRLRGNYSLQRTNANPDYALGLTLGLELGTGATSALGSTTFVPGALADVFTSWGGSIYEYSGQFSILSLLQAGAAGCYGTVIEPCNYTNKFPSPQAYFYQARGFNVAECFYQSLSNPYEGLLLGEPLAAPFALPPSGSWSAGLGANALLAGTTNLSLQFNAADATRPVQQVDLFVDGTFAQTLTNIPPRPNNQLNITIRGQPASYTVPAGATVQSVTTGLTALLNASSYTNVTKARAIAHGDRIELQSFDPTQPGGQIPVSANSALGSASALTSFITASSPSFLDSSACGIRSFSVANAPSAGSYLLLTVTKTNGTVVTLGATNSAGNTSISALTQTLVNLINATPALQGSDGLTAEDFVNNDGNSTPQAQFNLRALCGGWSAAQLQAKLSGSSAFTFQPSGTQKLDSNLSDLEPRNHLYVTAGLTSLPLTFAFNTTTQADGYHELTAVAYEGSHVRTQQRLAQTVRIQNMPLAATFTTLLGGTNTALGATLQFSVAANTNTISKIELFSTGGSLSNVPNQSTALFSVAGASLGLGLHPFYAIVTATGGKQYRTETKWLRLIGPDSPFPVSIGASPPRLAWPATAGRRYDVLSATRLAGAFQPAATVTPSNSAGQWTETNAAVPGRFYRVRSAN